MSNRDKELVPMTCSECGCEFSITYGRYRRFDKDHKWKCYKCNIKQLRESFSKLSDEEKAEYRRRKSEVSRLSWERDRNDPDAYKRRCECQKIRWSKLSKEEISRIMQKTHDGHTKYMRQDHIRRRTAERNRKRWASMTDEERCLEIIRLNKIRQDNWDNMTPEERFIKMNKMWTANNTIGPTEFAFNNVLRSIGLIPAVDYIWSYNTYPFIHENFYDVFGIKNQLTGEDNIPYHSWDFALFINSDIPILVDVDRSAHNPKCMMFKRKHCTYTEREKIDMNDSKRPYQIPDGMLGYIVQAHDDKITDTTKVVGVTTNCNMNFSNFIKFIMDRVSSDSSKSVEETSSTIDQL